ncbi:acyltransferase [Enterobacter sp. R1(2018)]|uniref:acyltransferase n=1 Tax=Enterobacter sp. R1(2018) TaxID=2447891 RepID=UPI00160042CA|nr:acyltransferase [Enterobacter sp. R1(2018)]
MDRFDSGYCNDERLADLGFKSLGKNVLISRMCNIVGIGNISIGDNVRIDAFTTIIATGDGYLNIGSYVHIGGYSALFAGSGIEVGDFAGLSQGVKIYSKSDDYSGEFMTNPTVPSKYTGVIEGKVTIGRHAIIGSQSIVMPGIEIAEGVAVGANSLVTKNTEEWSVYFGSPAKKIKNRKRNPLNLELELKKNI